MSEDTRLIRLDGVRELTGLSRSTIYFYMATGEFPQAVNIGPRAVAWVESEVREWVAARIASHRRGAPHQEAVSVAR